MNTTPPGVPPIIGARKSRWIGWAIAAVLAAVVVLAIVRSYHPFPSAEERQYFGWWYGWEKIDDDKARAWIAEFREDGTLHIAFGYYFRVNADKAWQRDVSEEHGTWRVRDRVQRLVSDDPNYRLSWEELVDRLLNAGDTHRHHDYRTTLINEHELHYTSLSEGSDYVSLHARQPVELPAEPLPPEQWPMKTLKN